MRLRFNWLRVVISHQEMPPEGESKMTTDWMVQKIYISWNSRQRRRPHTPNGLWSGHIRYMHGYKNAFSKLSMCVWLRGDIFSPFLTSYHRINQLWHVLLFPLSSFLYLKNQHFKTFNIRQTFSWRNNVFYLPSFVGGIWKVQWSREGRNKYKLRDLRLPNLICSRELRPPLFPKSCVAWRMNGCWSIVLTAHRGLFTMFSILI